MPARDAKGRFKKGCTHSRNYSTRRCRSKKEHDASLQKLRRRSAMRRIGRQVSEKRRLTHVDGYAQGYEPF